MLEVVDYMEHGEIELLEAAQVENSPEHDIALQRFIRTLGVDMRGGGHAQ